MQTTQEAMMSNDKPEQQPRCDQCGAEITTDQMAADMLAALRGASMRGFKIILNTDADTISQPEEFAALQDWARAMLAAAPKGKP